jgi:hypothetical protein
MVKELRDILPDFVHQMALDLFNESFPPWWEEYLVQYAVVLFMLTEIAMADKKEEEEKAVRYVQEYLDSRKISDWEEYKDLDWLHFHLSSIRKLKYRARCLWNVSLNVEKGRLLEVATKLYLQEQGFKTYLWHEWASQKGLSGLPYPSSTTLISSSVKP